MKFKYDKQDGIKDCGVCCLYNIIRYYNGKISFEKLRNMTNTNKNGTSVYDIVNTSNKLGLKAKAYKCEINDLIDLNYPIIAHINVEEKYSHFIIIEKIEDTEIFIFDPIRGKIKYEIDKFLSEWSGHIITFEKTNELVYEEDTYKSYLVSLIKENKKYLIIISLLSIMCTFLSSLNSIYIQNVIDNFNSKIIYIFIFISTLYLIIFYIKNRIIINFNTKIDKDLTKNIYNHILFLPIKYHHTRASGDVVSRVYDLYYIKDFINHLSFSVIVDIFLVFIISIFIFLINKLIFLLSFFILLIFVFIYLFYREKINNLIYINQEEKSKVNSILVENILGIDTIKNLNLEENFIHKQNTIYNSYLQKNKKLSHMYNSYETLVEFTSKFSIIIILFIGSIYIKNNILTIGNLVAIYSLLINLFSSIRNLINTDSLIINSKNAYKRLNELFNVEIENDIMSSKKFSNQICFNNFNYSYNDNNLLNDFNLNILKNDYILITGESGIGKSTLFKALTKQINVNPNMILLDNMPLNNFSNNYIKNEICFTSQNEFIFTDSIKNNIILNSSFKKDDFIKALKVSLVDEILNKKNIDINYLLEENGHNLSGGERQKILIARALLSGRKIIIFDETMNEIDVKSERKILKNIKAEYNKTIILVSHRLSNSDLFSKCISL